MWAALGACAVLAAAVAAGAGLGPGRQGASPRDSSHPAAATTAAPTPSGAPREGLSTSSLPPLVPSAQSGQSGAAPTPSPATAPAQRLRSLEPTTTLVSRFATVVGAGSAAGLAGLARDVDTAIPAVRSVLPTWTSKVTVLSPSDPAVMAELVGGDFGDPAALRQVSAVTTGPASGSGAVVVVNTEAMSTLTALGRRVVLAHELTHVATREAGGAPVAAWLTEGFADYVGFRRTGVPDAVAAQDVVAEVRAGRLPGALPAAAAFLPTHGTTSPAYQQAWLACRVVAARWGEAALVRLYRAAASSSAADADARTRAALVSVLHVDEGDLVALWRSALLRLAQGTAVGSPKA